MKAYASEIPSTRIGRAAIVILAAGLLAVGAAHANPSNNIVLVPPAALPELARQGGEAMLLHETVDGRALLYVEQLAGTQLAVFDVTDPVHVKSEGAVHLDAAGAFEFVSPVGSNAVLVRFRHGEEALLDLHKADVPKLKPVQGLTSRGTATLLGEDGVTVSAEAAESPAARNYQVIDTADRHGNNRVFDVQQVREEILKSDTGTTFLLAQDGLYLVRRPSVEMTHQMMIIPPN